MDINYESMDKDKEKEKEQNRRLTHWSLERHRE